MTELNQNMGKCVEKQKLHLHFMLPSNRLFSPAPAGMPSPDPSSRDASSGIARIPHQLDEDVGVAPRPQLFFCLRLHLVLQHWEDKHWNDFYCGLLLLMIWQSPGLPGWRKDNCDPWASPPEYSCRFVPSGHFTGISPYSLREVKWVLLRA